MPIDIGRVGPLRSGPFRFAFLLAAVFAIGSALVLGVVQRQVSRYAAEALDSSLRAETAMLEGEYRDQGLSGLVGGMRRRRHVTGEPEFSYLLLAPGGRRLYGDLPASAAKTGWGLVYEDEAPSAADPGGREVMKRLGSPLPGGLLLVVATDAFDIEILRTRLLWFTLASEVGITLFALVGGYLVGQRFTGRLNRVNAAVDRIMDGDLAERLPAIGFSPEFNQLSANLNQMLDRNAALMEGLRQVSSDIAHDLRTPLTRLHQQLQRMKEEDTPQAYAVGVDDALIQTEQLLRIFQALLRIGALEGGVGRQRFAAVDLSEVMERVHLAFRPVAEDGGRQLIAEHQADVQVVGDADLLAQLFTNLVENGLVHTPPGATIVSRLHATDANVCIEVSDNGPGVPAAEHAKVFQRFYRRDASRHAPGAGLGLALVAAIAALHRADIVVADNGPGLRIAISFVRA